MLAAEHVRPERCGRRNGMAVGQEFYRGYRISFFGEGSAWSFELFPMGIDFPHPGRSIFFKVANSKPRALSLAKVEIDWLFTRRNAARKAI
jgi:hypothetical protein